MPTPVPDVSQKIENDLENEAVNISPDARLGLAARLLASVPAVTRSNLTE